MCNSAEGANLVLEPLCFCDLKNILLCVRFVFFFLNGMSNLKATYKPSSLTFSFCLTLLKKIREECCQRVYTEDGEWWW